MQKRKLVLTIGILLILCLSVWSCTNDPGDVKSESGSTNDSSSYEADINQQNKASDTSEDSNETGEEETTGTKRVDFNDESKYPWLPLP